MKKRILAGALFLIALFALVCRASRVALPERHEYGALWSMYLREPRDSVDVLFFGSSMAYCDVIPAELYERTGLSSWVMAGPEQTFSITYDYIREALRTQSPSVIFLELSGVMYERYMGFTKANVAYMPYWSVNRLEATLRGAERGEWAGLFFPLYNYHDLLGSPLSLLRARPDETLDPLAGFTLMTEAFPQETRGERDYATSEETFAENAAELRRIQTLCAQRGIRLVLFQAPSCAYLPAAWMERLREAAGPEAEIVDFNEQFEAMGLDLQRDFCDFLHTNVSGARKFTAALAAYLQAGQPVEPCGHDEALWAWRVREFAARTEAGLSGTETDGA